MPKNIRPAGMRMPSHVLNSVGVWVRSKFAGMRIGKNTKVSDFADLKDRKSKTHTTPVLRTPYNSGIGLHANKQYAKNEVRKENLRKQREQG